MQGSGLLATMFLPSLLTRPACSSDGLSPSLNLSKCTTAMANSHTRIKDDCLNLLIVGGGVIGLACAKELAESGHDVVLIERHRMLGSETSSRNSEVIHAGIYYPPESLKTELCIEGRARMLAFSRARGVRFSLCGKLIVACTEAEISALDQIEERAAQAGPEIALQRWSQTKVRSKAPAVRAVQALWSAGTGIVDGHQFMHQLRVAAEQAGALILPAHSMMSAHSTDPGFEIELTLQQGPSEQHYFDAVVNAAGHGAVQVARHVCDAVPEQIAVKGNYFAISGPAPADTLIYPVPRPNLVGLGTHLTIDLAGRARLGPDVELDADSNQMAVSADRLDAVWSAARHFLPSLRRDQLMADYAGFRPKLAVDRFADFHIGGDDAPTGWINLLGIESPGLTASLAIARRVRAQLDQL